MGKRLKLRVECGQKKRVTMRISGGMLELAAIAHICVPKCLISARLDFWWDYNRNTKRSRCSNLYTNVGARWGGGAEPAHRPDGLGRFFFTGVAEENWDVYPHLDEITGNDHIDRLQTGSGRERSES